MGRMGFPYYGEDLGSAIQDAEKLTAKIKTNKYSKKDLLALVDANNAIIKHLIENENKD
jgi:hypothetical protein